MSDDTVHDTEETVHGTERTRSRRGITTYLRRLANRLRRGEPVPVDEQQTVTVDPPAEAEIDIEVEREDGEVSLGIDVEWEKEDGDVQTDVVASKATFEVYEDAAEEYRWRLRHRNGNIIADGGEGYASRQKAEQGLESVAVNAPGADLFDESRDELVGVETDDSRARFELFEDSESKWRWRLVHDNGEVIADGGQGYSSKQKAKQGLRSVRQNAPGAPVEDGE
jgi:amphi-Trp domain-containing protein